jgi:outer membrane cobalamin receptor
MSLLKFRRLIITSALTVSACQIAQAADDSSLPHPEQQGAATTTLPNILVTGDTQHLPQSFDQRYASTPVSLAIGILNPQDVTDQTWLNRRPRQTVNLSVDHMWDEFRLHALRTGGTLLYGGSTFDDQFNTTYLPSYTTVGLRAAYKVNSHLTVSANLSNLFNRQYETAYGYNSLGRTAFGKVSCTF